MEVYDALRKQAAEDAHMTLRSMGYQLLINVVVSLVVILCVSYLRPRHSLAYPVAKSTIDSPRNSSDSSDTKIAQLGWSDWLKQLYKVSDEFLIERIGFDAVLYLRFMRLLRNILVVLTITGFAVLMPINVAATRLTGEWPPVSFDIGFLSISGINFRGGQEIADPDQSWYWSPVVATWFFTFVICLFFHRSANDYLEMRKKFYRSPAYSLSSRSLFISSIPAHVRSDVDFKTWLESQGISQPIEQVWLGRQNLKLLDWVRCYRTAVYNLEAALAGYMKGAPGNRKRPRIRNWKARLPFFQGQTHDAIDYYTKQVSDLNRMIRLDSTKENDSTTDYGWVTFPNRRIANKALQDFRGKRAGARACVSPPAKDVFWPNMSIPRAMRNLKIWFGRGVFVSFMVIWLIPIAILSALSNMVNLIRMYPESRDMIEKHSFVIGLVQAYITPLTMGFLFYLLPYFFRYIAVKQGYLTRTIRDSKVLAMLYIFFLINHLLLFTISSMFISLYGQLRQLVLDGILGDEYISQYVAQLAKNMSEVSSFWINLYCIRAFGVSLELVQIVPVLTITLRKYFMRLTPRRFKKLAMPPNFDFALNYNIILFFFTIALIYSSTAPLVLPFALVYFVTSSFVYKYMLMYIYVTKVESGGNMFPVLFQSTMTSTVVFQLVSFLLLLLKGGYEQGLGIVPLPLFTFAFQIWYGRRLKRLASRNVLAMDEESTDSACNGLLHEQYRNPLLNHTYLMPVIHNDMKTVLAQIYPNYHQQQNLSEAVTDVDEQHQPFGLYPTNPDFHVVLHNPAENRSVVFHTVTDDYYLYDQDEDENYCPCCHASAPPFEELSIPLPRDEKKIEEPGGSEQHEPSAPPLSLLETRRKSGTIEDWRQRMDVQRLFQPAPQSPELPTYSDAIRSADPPVRPYRRHSDPSVYNTSNTTTTTLQ
ncbi:hypothetical protein BJV82DRAFT_674900 [Fennellomyces sp. T-0311]|nr:hypothetical protein BJV82DRAFT_674900 [Fennellomyces sp. T-0311]